MNRCQAMLKKKINGRAIMCKEMARWSVLSLSGFPFDCKGWGMRQKLCTRHKTMTRRRFGASVATKKETHDTYRNSC